MINKDNIASLFGLSPLQEGIFFHSLSESGTGTYFEQYQARLKGDFNPDLYQKAWQAVLDRHDILRTSFVWEGLPKPYQIVEKKATLPWTCLDWQSISSEAQSNKLDLFLKEDIARGFDLARGPLLRMTLIQMTANEWVAVLSIHHIIMDGWSGTIIMGESSACYNALSQNQPISLPTAPSYQQYVSWLENQDKSKARDYWATQLADYDNPLILPMDQAPFSATEESDQYLRLDKILPGDETEKLKKFASQQGVTLNSCLQAAWAILLSKYCRRPDILFGTSCATRPTEIDHIDHMVGLLLNTLPIRLTIQNDLSSADWVRHVQVKLAEARSHDYLSLTELRGYTDLNQGEPLFETLTVFENYPSVSGSTDDGRLSVEIADGFEKTSCPISLMGFPGDEIALRILYDGHRFESADIERLLGHLSQILYAFADFPDQILADLTYLCQDEINLIQSWCQGDNIVPSDGGDFLKAIHHFAQKTPDYLAVSAEDGSLSYQALLQKSGDIADLLTNHNIGSGDIVGLYLEAGYLWPATVLAVLSVGAVWLPLDPAYPDKRLDYLISDSKCRAIITADLPPSRLQTRFEGPLISLSSLPAQSQRSGLSIPEYQPDNPAYLIYTSGSTGTPKGVLNSVQGLGNLMTALQHSLSISSEIPHVLQFASLNFDASVLELVLALSNGGCLHLSQRSKMADPQMLSDILISRKITHALLPPTMLRLLNPSQLPDFRNVIVGGEACPDDLAALWQQDRHFYNFYGPTEAAVYTIAACYYQQSVAGIGRPVANTTAQIIDENGGLCPIGVPGELIIGGPSLALGYHHQPELTADKYRSRHPLSDGGITRFYYSGDLASWDQQGNIHYLGRLDDQIKIRGYRIEPAEIEAVIQSHPAISDSIVLPIEHNGQQDLAAFIHPAPETLTRLKQEQVDIWRQRYAEIYQELGAAPLHPSQNFHGWTTNYTNADIDIEEMQAWADHTAQQLKDLNPKRILEVGCGQGLLYFRLIDHCQHYTAIDFSQDALDCIQKRAETDHLNKTSLHVADAADIDLANDQKFDLIILNSIIQYFPDETYLRQVLNSLRPHMDAEGIIFLGDLRNLAMARAHHTMIQWQQLQNGITNEYNHDGNQQFLKNIQARLHTESELLLHPNFADHFAKSAFPQAQGISFCKPGFYDNELSQFRYDSLIFLAPENTEPVSHTSISAKGFSADEIRKTLNDNPDPIIELRELTLSAHEFTDFIYDQAEKNPEDSISDIATRYAPSKRPLSSADLNRIAEETDYYCYITPPQSRPNNLSVLFGKKTALNRSELLIRYAQLCATQHTDLQPSLCNLPFQMGQQNATEKKLRQYLKHKLPQHMIPSQLLTIYVWPKTPNGKIDRQKLLASALTARQQLPDVAEKPETETEKYLAQIYQNLLGLDTISRQSDFFQLGGHSILAAQLAFRIRADLWADFPTNGVYETSDIAALAQRIDQKDQEDTLLDLRKDSLLPAHIARLETAPPLQPDHIFLTGATGYVGCHLLATLLEQTKAQITCLSRDVDKDRFMDRIKQQFDIHKIKSALPPDRVKLCKGDLSLPQLGLSEPDLNWLENECQAIYHCGAWVDFLHPYKTLKAANVDSLKTILTMVSTGCPKSLHYISTLGIIDHSQPIEDIHENSPLEDWQGLAGGYNQSKWVADRCARRAIDRGLPVSIYRLGSITGSADAGICQETDLIWRLCQAYATLGAYPPSPVTLQMTPVDDVACAIVALSQSPQIHTKIFHLTGAHIVTWPSLIEVMQAIGYKLTAMPAEQWLQSASDYLDHHQNDNLSAILPIFQNSQGIFFNNNVNADLTHTDLRHLQAEIGDVTFDMLTNYLTHLLGMPNLQGK